MAEIAVPITDLDINARSGDLVALGTTVIVANTFKIAAGGRTEGLMLLVEEQGVGASTVTFNAGANPPSKRGALGGLPVVLAVSDARLVQLEGGRFIQDDGSITGSVATNPVKITAFRASRLW